MGRTNGMCKWRRGWRSDVLRIRNGLVIEQPEQPSPSEDSGGTSNSDAEGEQLQVVVSTQEQARLERVWRWWRQDMGAPKLVLAPMIGQSDLAFRLLCRENGVTLCYTQMYLDEAVTAGEYDDELMAGAAAAAAACSPGRRQPDRPLVCQIAGSRPESMAAAARHLEALGVVDAVDVNFGCPQRCAREGGYGSFLLQDDPALAVRIVQTMSSAVALPVMVKMRLHLGGIEQTIATARRFEAAGAAALCLHGRTNAHAEHDGPADWAAVRAVKRALHIPLIANGSVQSSSDAVACLRYTGADAVMSGTGLLRSPSLLVDVDRRLREQAAAASGDGSDGSAEPVGKRARLTEGIALGPRGLAASLRDARRYLALAGVLYVSDLASTEVGPGKHTEQAGRHHPPACKVMRDHLFAMLQAHVMDVHRDLWSLLGCEEVRSVRQFAEVLNVLERREEGAAGADAARTPVFSLHDIKFSRFSLGEAAPVPEETAAPGEANGVL